ncbi:MAG: hypothetical protein VZS44_10560 [Bacilli bacterium]|nr:hypothetical protein [Bacilli bacterium]
MIKIILILFIILFNIFMIGGTINIIMSLHKDKDEYTSMLNIILLDIFTILVILFVVFAEIVGIITYIN